MSEDMTRKVLCAECGKYFFTGDFRRKYCSGECRRQAVLAHKRNWARRHADPPATRTYECAECGRQFRSRAGSGRKHCCLECLIRAENKTEEGFCRRCGREIADHGRKKFCSPACAGESQYERMLLKKRIRSAEK